MADKTSKKEFRKQKRVEERARKAREERTRTIVTIGGLVLIVAITLGLVLFTAASSNPIGTFVQSLGNQHVGAATDPHVPYNSTPPTSGPHLGGIAEWGIHKEPIPNELQVHNLEDAGVNIQYDCAEPESTSCKEMVAALTLIVTSYQQAASSSGREARLVLAPYPGIRQASGGKPIALTAWQHILYLDTVDEAKIRQFIDAYMGIDHHVAGQG